ncbi:MAG TPA: glycoside hydrolase family 44 protein, partial [Verrucomicrobiae bacterium]|nr:glycoside hydrolase family 44 protein [Verrucomicrobiae bacterium]
MQLYHSDMDASLFTSVSFWVNGGTSGGQRLQMYGLLHVGSTNNFAASQRYSLSPLTANAWQQVTVPLSLLGVANSNNFTGFVIQDSTGAAQPTFYVDDISLVAASLTPGTNAPVAISVDAQADRHAISPLIYGTAFATSNQLLDLNFTVNRSGGNAETRYNWQLNAHNRAADWYFESLDDGNSTPGASADDFVADSKNGGAEAMITIPMIGWMPKLGPNRARLSGYSIAKYGPQTGNDAQWFPDAGNGV